MKGFNSMGRLSVDTSLWERRAIPLYATRALLHLVVFLGLCSFLTWIFIWLDPDYDKYTGKFGEGEWNLFYKSGPDAGTVVMYGYQIVNILYAWVGILAAIFAVALLNALPKMSSRNGNIQGLYEMRLRARALAKWQFPMHKFWVAWCGGLSAADILVIAIYLALHGTWFAWLVKSDEDRFSALKETGLPLPHSLSLCRLERYALDFGVLLWPTLLLLYFPMAHVSFLADWLGVHYADMIRWHRWVGQGTMWILSIHGILYYIYWGCIHHFWWNFADWSTINSINNLAGSIAWFFGIGLWVTSINWVRRRFWEVFYRFHIACFIFFVIFSTIHYANAWTWWLPGLLVYAIDVVLRAGQSLNATTISAHASEDNTFTTMEVKLAKKFHVNPNEELFVLIPQISYWQWHPFTVYEVKHMPNGSKRAVMHCKVYNAWTTELCRRSKLQHLLAARVVGPLGNNRDAGLWQDYGTVVLLGGGIGAIPVLAILKDIMKRASGGNVSVGAPLKPPASIRKLVFAWVSRHGSEFSLLDDELLHWLKSCDWLDVKFFIAQPLQPKQLTGLDGDEACGAGVNPKWLPLTHHWASPLKLSPDRPAQARLHGPIMEILVGGLVFAGGFFATVLGGAYNAEGSITGEEEDMTFYWRTGMVLLACQTVMILGLPYALVVLPVNLYNAWKDKRARLSVHPGSNSSGSSDSASDDGKDVKAAHLSLESFIAQTASISYGRPDVPAIINEAVARREGHVGIFAGGPESFRAAASNAAYAVRQNCNLIGSLVHYFDESHEL